MAIASDNITASVASVRRAASRPIAAWVVATPVACAQFSGTACTMPRLTVPADLSIPPFLDRRIQPPELQEAA